MDTMPNEIEGFSHVEYLMVFNAIIYAYVVAEYFVGWGVIIRNRKTTKIYWQHILWTVFAFVLLIQNWWGIWPRTGMINDNVGYFCYSIVPIILFHLISVILFPNPNKEEEDLKVYFYENTRWLFSLFAIYFLLTILSSYVYLDVGDIMIQNLLRGFGVALALAAAYFNKSVVIHVIFLIIGCASLVRFFLALL